MSSSARQENRWRKSLYAAGSAVNDRQREAEAMSIVRVQRPVIVPIAPPATRGQVRNWMRQNSPDYETATELAESANAALNLPEGAIENETHWVWEEALLAIDD